MGVRHAREYSDILTELTAAVGKIGENYTFFEMEKDEWDALAEEERSEVMEALADDVFFGLGEHPVIEVGQGAVSYNNKHHVIEVTQGDNVIQIIRLI